MKLYALTRDPDREPSPAALMSAAQRHLRHIHARSTAALDAFIDWARRDTRQIDVCRAAGERYQATRLFRHLAAHGLPRAASLRDRFARLTDDWYLVHMLGTHEQRLSGRRRDRVIRLLEQLGEAERETTALVLR